MIVKKSHPLLDSGAKQRQNTRLDATFSRSYVFSCTKSNKIPLGRSTCRPRGRPTHLAVHLPLSFFFRIGLPLLQMSQFNRSFTIVFLFKKWFTIAANFTMQISQFYQLKSINIKYLPFIYHCLSFQELVYHCCKFPNLTVHLPSSFFSKNGLPLLQILQLEFNSKSIKI